nr:hypothetical protein [uncultured bacterium]
MGTYIRISLHTDLPIIFWYKYLDESLGQLLFGFSISRDSSTTVHRLSIHKECRITKANVTLFRNARNQPRTCVWHITRGTLFRSYRKYESTVLYWGSHHFNHGHCQRNNKGTKKAEPLLRFW